MLSRRRALIENAASGKDLPSGYTRKQYIQGATNAGSIERGAILFYKLPFTNDYSYRIEAETISHSAQNGFFISYSDEETRLLGVTISTNLKIQFRRNGNYTETNIPFLINQKYIFEQNPDGSYVNGTKVLDFVNSSFTQDTYILLGYLGRASIWKVYSLIVKNEKGENVFNGIPALDENGRSCLYDTVSRIPIYSITNTDFYTN